MPPAKAAATDETRAGRAVLTGIRLETLLAGELESRRETFVTHSRLVVWLAAVVVGGMTLVDAQGRGGRGGGAGAPGAAPTATAGTVGTDRRPREVARRAISRAIRPIARRRCICLRATRAHRRGATRCSICSTATADGRTRSPRGSRVSPRARTAWPRQQGLQRVHRRDAERLHAAQGQHVFGVADDRRLGALHRRRPRRPTWTATTARWPRA
jgi:hypothetical protein